MATSLLAKTQVQDFSANGVLFPLSGIGQAEAERYCRLLEASEAAFGAQAKAVLRHKGHLALVWLNELMHHPDIISAVIQVLGPDILCWTSNAFIKDPGDGSFVSWHQDATYWGLGEDRVVTAWVALTPSTPENGCMRVVPGSHRWRQVPHVDKFEAGNLLTRGQEIAVRVNEAEARDIVLSPGQMSLHHVLIAHASGPNRSTRRRIGIAFRYIAPDVTQSSGLRDSATLVAGKDQFGHFDLEPSPQRDMDPASLDYWRRVVDGNAQILYRGAATEGHRTEGAPN